MKGFVAGAIGGLIGTWAMSEAQRAWTHAADDEVPASAGGKHDARDWQERDEHQNSNELAAQAVACYLMDRRLTHDELRIAAPVLHYAFGTAVGAMYGAYAERRHRKGSGAWLGTTSRQTKSRCPSLALGADNPAAARDASAIADRSPRVRRDDRSRPTLGTFATRSGAERRLKEDSCRFDDHTRALLGSPRQLSGQPSPCAR